MKRDLMNILVCPVCKGKLTITVTKETDKEIIEGTLCCAQCDGDYPIQDTVPNLLPSEMRD